MNVEEQSQASRILILSHNEGSGLTDFVREKAYKYLQQCGQESSQLITIGGNPADGPTTVFELYVGFFRRHALHENERMTVLGPSDQLIAMQLMLASRNKQNLGDYDVDVSKVFEINSNFIRFKLSSIVDDSSILPPCSGDTDLIDFANEYNSFLRDCNLVDWTDVFKAVSSEILGNTELRNILSASDFLVLNPGNDVIERYFIHELAKRKECINLSISMSLDESFGQMSLPSSAEITFEKCPVDEVLSCLSSSYSSAHSNFSSSEGHICQIFLAYMELLVNSRNEIALARVINVPERKLDHGAFTDIKHEAKRRNMPMYQTIQSFVMRTRLGGKSYAPKGDCTLSKHAEGLGKFNDLMHKLQTILEDDVIPESAMRKILNVIRCNVAKCTSRRFKSESIDKIVGQLEDQVKQLMSKSFLVTDATPTRNAKDGSTVVGRKTLRIMRTLLDHNSSFPSCLRNIDVLTEAFSFSQNTPLRFPSIMSLFRSPDENIESDSDQLLQPLAKRISANEENRPTLKLSVRNQPSSDFPICKSSNCLGKAGDNRSGQILSKQPDYRRKIFESADDKENKIKKQQRETTTATREQQSLGESLSGSSSRDSESHVAAKGVKRPACSAQNEISSSGKAKVQSTAATKRPKVAGKTSAKSKSKVIPLPKGQQTLNSFLRV